MRRIYPSEVVTVAKSVNPLTYDITAIVKQLGALKKFPVLIFERPLNAHGQPTDMKVVMSAENSQKKIQVALGLPHDMDRAEMARECLRREAAKIGPAIVGRDTAPVKEIIRTGDAVDLRLVRPELRQKGIVVRSQDAHAFGVQHPQRGQCRVIDLSRALDGEPAFIRQPADIHIQEANLAPSNVLIILP
jgi:hypothetical protein